MKTWRRSLLLLTATSALLLTGCTGGGSSTKGKLEAAQSVYRTMSGCTAQAEITADYGQRVYGYTVDLTVKGGSGVMTVKEPENLAGTVLTWSDGETQLAFDGAELDTGALSDSGLSPADAMPTILTACQGGEIVDCCMEEQAGAQVLHGPGGVLEVAIEDEVLRPGNFSVLAQQKGGGVQVEGPAGVKGVHVPAQAHQDLGQTGVFLGQTDFLPLFQTDRHSVLLLLCLLVSALKRLRCHSGRTGRPDRPGSRCQWR